MDVEYLVQRLSEEVFVQVWKYIAFPDDRICGYCKDLNGKKYSYHTSRKPQTPLHANCRCYYELQKIPYDGKKSATLTGFAEEARYIINEFIFDTDNNGRVISASGRLQSISGLRNARNQMRAAAWGLYGYELEQKYVLHTHFTQHFSSGTILYRLYSRFDCPPCQTQRR